MSETLWGARFDRWWKLCPIFLVVALGGCGGAKTGAVTGRITYRDKPLNFGRVYFFAADNDVVYSEIGPDGNYTIPKIAAGPAKITVVTPDLRKMPESGRGMMMDPTRMGNPDADNPGKPGPRGQKSSGAPPVFVPEIYGKLEESGLSLNVQAGENTHDIPLK